MESTNEARERAQREAEAKKQKREREKSKPEGQKKSGGFLKFVFVCGVIVVLIGSIGDEEESVADSANAMTTSSEQAPAMSRVVHGLCLKVEPRPANQNEIIRVVHSIDGRSETFEVAPGIAYVFSREQRRNEFAPRSTFEISDGGRWLVPIRTLTLTSGKDPRDVECGPASGWPQYWLEANGDLSRQ